MSFNVEKCHVLTVTRRQKTKINADYKLHDQTLEPVKDAVYLGVNLTQNLDWGKHIGSKAAKANSTSSFVARNLKGCPTAVQTHCFKALVRPAVEYASVVWSPYKKDQKETLEKVQRRAARRICCDYRRTTSATALLQRLGMESLESRRVMDRACMTYKVMKSLVDIKLPSTLDNKKEHTMALRGHQDKRIPPQPHSDTFKYSFFPDAIRIWNSLPTDAVSAPSIPSFRTALRGWVPPPPPL